MILKNPLLGLGVLRAQRFAPSIPARHEVIGGQHVPEQFGGVALQLAENLRGELVVALAQRGDPRFKREGFPVTQVSREAYEFFSRSLADFGLLTS